MDISTEEEERDWRLRGFEALGMPRPNAEEVERFKELMREHFGKELDDEEAKRQATALVRLVWLARFEKKDHDSPPPDKPEG